MIDPLSFAIERHGDQRYGSRMYSHHLLAVVKVLMDVGVGIGGHDYALLTAAKLHDIVEDTETTIDEVRHLYGDEVADYVWAVTGVGENRKERNKSQYAKIAALPKAAILKVADRIANAEAVLAEGKVGLAEMYLSEHRAFAANAVVLLPASGHVGTALASRYFKAVLDLEQLVKSSEESSS